MTLDTEEKAAKCERCKVRSAEALHKCPYASEINDDLTECNCCDDCQANCADEI